MKLTMRMDWALAMWIFAMGTSGAQTVREACAADVAKYCSNAQDLQSRITCMNAHQDELSEECRKARQANRISQGVVGGTQGPRPTANLQPAADSAPAFAGPLPSDGGLDTIADRLAGHGFPSVFQQWVEPRTLRKSDGTSVLLSSLETRLDSMARSDVIWISWHALGLKPTPGHEYPQLGAEFTPESLTAARRNRARLLAKNPNLVLLVDAHYQSAKADVFPPNSSWWIRDAQWERGIGGTFNSRRLDFHNPQLQDSVAAYCADMVKTNLFDGCMLDWWNDADQSADRLALIKKIRAAVGEKAIILGNVNQREPTITAPYLNGVCHEGFGANFFPDWRMAAQDLLWDESHLRTPAITALEGYPVRGRDETQTMREVTTLSLVFSNGSVLFTPPNPTPPPIQLNTYYSFWDKSLGRPVGPLADLNRPDLQGDYTRKYENGEVVFNPPGNRPVTLNFPTPMRSAANGTTSHTFTVAAGDGDLFLKQQ
jgi:hypothetical protein